jgi:anthranilate synthase/aminodeoxychorismate synthase-like glutamine amidotransferase
MILVIDNYDSFVYNLVQRLGEIDSATPIEVVRNDAITLDEVAARRPSHIIISPGPCTPNEAGISNELVKRFASEIPILGVCLGHQCIGAAFGGEIVRAPTIMHGKTSMIHHDGRGIFREMSNPFVAARYHSLVIERKSFDDSDFEISAWTDDRLIMGVRHRRWPLNGVQFHPESFMTDEGTKLLKNFLDSISPRH